MKHLRLVVTIVLASVFAASCRAVQIHRLEERQDRLEARIATLEGKVEMLSRK